MRSVLALGATMLANEAYAGCSFGDYKTYIPETFVGLQTDVTGTSACKTEASTFVSKIEQWVTSLGTITLDNFMEPAYVAAELGVSMTEVFERCETTTLAYKWADRFGTLEGFCNLIATCGVAYWSYSQNEASPLVDDLLAFIQSGPGTTCEAQSHLVGSVIKNSLDYYVSMEYVAQEVETEFKDKLGF